MGTFRRIVAAALLGAIVSLGGPALAQTSEPQRRERDARDGELPVDLNRIRRELARQTRTRESREGLRLAYYVEVYGTAPRLQLFTPGENVSTAPVRYGGMTHQEFLNVVTPQEFRSPAAVVKWSPDTRKNAPKTDK